VPCRRRAPSRRSPQWPSARPGAAAISSPSPSPISSSARKSGDCALLPAGEHAHRRGHRGAGPLVSPVPARRAVAGRMAHAVDTIAAVRARTDGHAGAGLAVLAFGGPRILAGTVLFSSPWATLMMHPLLRRRFGTRDMPASIRRASSSRWWGGGLPAADRSALERVAATMPFLARRADAGRPGCSAFRRRAANQEATGSACALGPRMDRWVRVRRRAGRWRWRC
jgi:hypothetical protein